MNGITKEHFHRLAKTAEADSLPCFQTIDEIAYRNTERVWQAFRHHRVSESHFAGATGYGYTDPGRDALDAVMADVLGAEDALVRIGFVGGTHAIACALRAAAPEGGYLSLVAEPYDTLQGILPYRVVPVGLDGNPNFAAIEAALQAEKPPAVLIQRSRGYSDRNALPMESVETLIRLCKSVSPEIVTVVDNCYCEFVETREPPMAGADLTAGSLIKNPGGGLAPTGGYIAGKTEWLNKAAECLTVPGIGREAGPSLGFNRLLFQGLYMAPHVVAQALKTAVFCAALMNKMGFSVSPRFDERRFDIIQSIAFGEREKLLRFACGIQKGSPVDSFATPEPWAMPGYSDEVVMAAGTFIQGASIELSCDGPLRPPFTAYMQGGLTYEAGRLGVMTAAEQLIIGVGEFGGFNCP